MNWNVFLIWQYLAIIFFWFQFLLEPPIVPIFLKIEHMIFVVDMSLHLWVATTLEIAHHTCQFAVLRFSFFFFLRTHDTLVQSLTNDFWTFIGNYDPRHCFANFAIFLQQLKFCIQQIGTKMVVRGLYNFGGHWKNRWNRNYLYWVGT